MIFLSARMDRKIRALDSDTGATLWEHQLDAGGFAEVGTDDAMAVPPGRGYVRRGGALVAWAVAEHHDAATGLRVVGAHTEDSASTGVNGNQSSNAASNSGAAYVFVRSGGQWSQQAYLKASNTGANDRFGGTVRISGDTVVISASKEDSVATGINGLQNNDGAPDSGAAYVFVREATVWTQQAYLKASNAETGDRFGIGTDISGDTIAIGASGYDDLHPSKGIVRWLENIGGAIDTFIAKTLMRLARTFHWLTTLINDVFLKPMVWLLHFFIAYRWWRSRKKLDDPDTRTAAVEWRKRSHHRGLVSRIRRETQFVVITG